MFAATSLLAWNVDQILRRLTVCPDSRSSCGPIPRSMYVLLYTDGMTEIAITDARGRLASIIDAARREPVYLTRRNRPVAAIIDTDQLSRLIEDAEELADIRAVDAAWEETERLGETPIPWEDVKSDLGLL